MQPHFAKRHLTGKWWHLLLIWIFLPQLALRADQIIYNGALQNGWENWSWATVNFTNTSPVYTGNSYSISVTCGGYSALYLENNPFNPSLYSSLAFWINGGAGGQSLTVFALTNGTPLNAYTFTAPTNSWQHIVVPLSALGLTSQTNADGFWIYNNSGATLPTFYVDGISLMSSTNAITANVTVNATHVINTVPTDAFGIFMAVWDTWGGNTPTQLKQAGVTAMRYPGGSYADSYQWSSYQMTPAFGQAGNLGYLSGATDMGHFIQLMSNAQAQAVISVDWGSGFLWNSNKTAMAIPSTNGSPQEAAAWVAYCNSSTNIYGTANDFTIGVDAEGNNWQTAGYWAMIRAARPLAQNDGYNFLRINHPAPVGIQYWEVGNEPYGNGYYGGGNDWECDYAVPYPYTNYTRLANPLLSPTAYGQAVQAFSIAMKAVDSTIKVGAYSSTPPGDYSWDYINGVNNGQHWTPQV
ncbi:MAG: hypothetical protein ACLPRE_04415 [Limisphaerales bacterium]